MKGALVRCFDRVLVFYSLLFHFVVGVMDVVDSAIPAPRDADAKLAELLEYLTAHDDTWTFW